MTIKPSEIRLALKNKLDPDVLKILLVIADDNRQLNSQMTEFAKIVDQAIDNMQVIQNVLKNVTGTLEQMPSAQNVLKSLRGNIVEGDLKGDDGHGSNG